MSSSLYKGFETYLKLEKNVSDNTLLAYLNDVQKYFQFLGDKKAEKVGPEDIREFVHLLHTIGLHPSSQARILSALRQFYHYVQLEHLIDVNPVKQVDLPKLRRKLPTVLSFEEIQRMMAAIDRSRPEGERSLAIIRTLYACGLRVSELVHLHISHIFYDDAFIRVIGKGNKERLVPIDEDTLEQIQYFISRVRTQWPLKAEASDLVFINQKGGGLSRISVFNLIKDLGAKAGIDKEISPHTFRHSYATHLVENGADLRAVQQLLGHESITTTEIYTHLDRRYLRETLEKYHPGVSPKKKGDNHR
jgi:integrase/recombinase XerD